MNSFFIFFKQKVPQFFYFFRLPILSGVLIGTSYIPFPPWALIFCYLPLWYWETSQPRSRSEIFKGAWVTQFVLTLIGFHWLAYTAHEFGNFPWSLSILVLILFAGIIHIHIPLSSALGAYFRERLQLNTATSILIQALILGLLERYSPLMIFRWHLGYPLLWGRLPVFHFADIIGFDGLAMIVLLLNAFACILYIQYRAKKTILVLVSTFVVLNLMGAIYGNYGSPNLTPDRKISFGIVQPEISNKEKLESEAGFLPEQKVLRSLTNDSKSILTAYPNTQIIVWPETAVPAYLSRIYWTDPRFVFLRDELAATDFTLLTGAYARDRFVYNSLFAFQSKDFIELSPAYKKHHLLVFGEYMPFGNTFPFLYKLLPFVADFGRGEGPIPMELDNLNIKVGPQICYEGLFPHFSTGLARRGAEVIVNVTNDSWYGYPFEPRQHLYMTFARAVETRLPLVRSTNSGSSGAITAQGKVLLASPTDTHWWGAVEVPLTSKPQLSFYSKFGHREVLIWVVLLIAILVHSQWKRVTKPSQKDINTI